MKENWKKLLPLVFVAVFALSRWPGLLPSDFSAATALAFCAGVYFRGGMAWWLPLGAMAVTDLALDVFYYHTGLKGLIWMLPNYLVYTALIGFGRILGAGAGFLRLLAGGVLGALIFYFVTNTIAWLQIPEYAKTFNGWIQALFTGLPGYPPTWEFFRNSLLSGGLFTALFVASEKLASTESPADKTAGAREPETPSEETTEEAKA